MDDRHGIAEGLKPPGADSVDRLPRRPLFSGNGRAGDAEPLSYHKSSLQQRFEAHGRGSAAALARGLQPPVHDVPRPGADVYRCLPMCSPMPIAMWRNLS